MYIFLLPILCASAAIRGDTLFIFQGHTGLLEMEGFPRRLHLRLQAGWH